MNGSERPKTEVLRHLRDTLATLHATSDPRSSAQAICQDLSDWLHSRLAVVYLADQDAMEPVATCPRDVDQPVDTRQRPLAVWQSLLDASTEVGSLRWCRDIRPFLDETTLEPTTSERELLGDDDVWGAANLLLAPMLVSGQLVGVLTVSLPVGAPVLDELTRTTLEILTLQAAMVIYQYRVHERGAADHLALRLSEERLRLAFDNAPIGIVELYLAESGPAIARINRAAVAMFGASTIRARHQPVDQVLAVMRGVPLSELIRELFERRRATLRVEVPFVGSDGDEFWGLVEAAALDHSPGEPGVLCQIVDITQAKAEKRELTKLAQHDALTGLPNRLVIMERLEAAVRNAAETDEIGALLFCDLDNFKAINDAHGHLVGDDALASLATRLHSVVRNGDTAGRFGGDEFVVISFSLREEAAERLAERIWVAMNAPMAIGGCDMQVGVSIGIAMITSGVSPEEVLTRADAAMYAVRSRRDRPLYVLDAG